jgi:prepilin-type N-terminal cleavage/methylation domain-containing protein
MTKRHDSKTGATRRNCQRGFTLVEVLMAIVILLVGIVAVAQLVPASINSNSTNQPLNMSISPPSFIDAQGISCNLGDPTQNNAVVGNPVVVFYDQLVIDFSSSPGVAGYSFLYQDPNDPAGVVYDVRWAVITVTNNGLVTSKRFILGVRRQGGNGIYRPVTLDTILSK